jgi:tetratricopeptide (TPR) repeat protein
VNWARMLNESGRAAEALPKAREAHVNLVRLVGETAPQAQDAAMELAALELQAGDLQRARIVIDQLDAGVLERFRATGKWAVTIGTLRGILLQRRGDHAAALPLLDAGLAAYPEQEKLAHPLRAYQMAKQARAQIR